MADFSYLMAQPQVQLPNPLDLAGKALTLGQMGTQIGLGQLSLQQQRGLAALYSDPSILNAVLGGQGPGAAPGGVPGGDLGSIVGNFIASHPGAGLAVPGFLKGAQDLQKTRAEIAKDQADALQAQQTARVAGLKALGGDAYRLMNGPNPPTLSDIQRIAYNANFLGVPNVLATMPNPHDPAATKQWLGSLYGMATESTGQETAAQTRALTGPKVALTQQQTAEAQAAAAAKPIEAQAAATSAAAAAQNAATNRLNASAPQIAYPPGGGPPQAIYRGIPGLPGSGPVPSAGAYPVTGAQAPTPAQKSLGEATGTAVGNEAKSLAGDYQGLNYLDAIEAREKAGIYGGGIQGTDWYKDVANIIASIPGAPAGVIDKIANTQVWEKGTSNLVLQALSGLPGNRVNQQELAFLSKATPSTMQQPQARQMLYGIIRQAMENHIGYIQGQAAHLAKPGVNDLSGWKPNSSPTPSTSPVRINGDDGYNALPAGTLYVGPDGVTRRK